MEDFYEGMNRTASCPEISFKSPAMFNKAKTIESRFGSPLYYQSLPVVRSKTRVSFWQWTSVRMARLCCFGILLPILCIVVPVYARYVLYVDSAVTLAASDMRLVDGHMSTAWCSGQKLQMNVSFDAFLMDRRPSVEPKAERLSMIRHFELDDDTKEYWGFYLLKGSEVSVSSCVRHLGANVMLIKGIGNLKFCAYVGQESREDESAEIAGLETRKLMEQYEMETGDQYRSPSPPMFLQPDKKDKSRILQLLKSRNEKRKIIKLLEKVNINADDDATNSSSITVSPTVLNQVEQALKKILHQEIQSLYQEVKGIIYPGSNTASDGDARAEAGNSTAVKSSGRQHWITKSLANDSDPLSALMEEVDESDNGAHELVDVNPDGIADDRGVIDHNHANDTSVSNEESSFSSSEEAMLNCRGVQISQPLVPDNQCTNTTDPDHNTITYHVEEDGYYYFIFSSANEKVKNKLTVKFTLQKTIYNVTGATEICFNSTTCHFPLNFVSDQQVVVKVPQPDNVFSSVWDQTFVAESICEPRVPLYLAFCMILPILILFCALQ